MAGAIFAVLLRFEWSFVQINFRGSEEGFSCVLSGIGRLSSPLRKVAVPISVLLV
ncbi:hypothetical protein Dimus_037559 [Dionaea muscipula]